MGQFNPPNLANRFLKWFCRSEILEEVSGDLFEYYQENRSKGSKWRAD
ncbi:permease prefix domain 2-containing transporter, partial [Fulvivirga lutimaris]